MVIISVPSMARASFTTRSEHGDVGQVQQSLLGPDLAWFYIRIRVMRTS